MDDHGLPKFVNNNLIWL